MALLHGASSAHDEYMERLSGLTVLPDSASGAMIRIASARLSRRVSYSLSFLLVTCLTGLILLLAPTIASRGLLELLLLAVLLVALGLGPGPALLVVAVGAAAGWLAVLSQAVEIADGALLGEVGLFVVEGATISFIGAIVRAAIGAAPHPLVMAGTMEVADPPAGVDLVEPLTAREAEILRAAAGGRSAAQLAAELYVSPNTVKTHLAHCYEKLGAHNRAEAVAMALRCGCLQAADVGRATEPGTVEKARPTPTLTLEITPRGDGLSAPTA
jgi:DNA-binding CsgD family transcriptional regulator